MQILAKFSLVALAILPKIQKIQMKFAELKTSRWEKEHLFKSVPNINIINISRLLLSVSTKKKKNNDLPINNKVAKINNQ